MNNRFRKLIPASNEPKPGCPGFSDCREGQHTPLQAAGVLTSLFLILFCLSGCGNAQVGDRVTLSFSEAEKKTPSIGANGRLTAGMNGSVLFCDSQGGVYESEDWGESWEKYGKGRQLGNSLIMHPALSQSGDFAYAARTQSAGFDGIKETGTEMLPSMISRFSGKAA